MKHNSKLPPLVILLPNGDNYVDAGTGGSDTCANVVLASETINRDVRCTNDRIWRDAT